MPLSVSTSICGGTSVPVSILHYLFQVCHVSLSSSFIFQKIYVTRQILVCLFKKWHLYSFHGGRLCFRLVEIFLWSLSETVTRIISTTMGAMNNSRDWTTHILNFEEIINNPKKDSYMRTPTCVCACPCAKIWA